MNGFQAPYARAGQAIGLLGGSFDPAHDGHLHITQEALKRFGLDQVWWVVSPGNPLKSRQPASMEARIAHAQSLVGRNDVEITDIEAQIGTRYTAETLSALQARYRGVRFVWLMGADNLAQFHLWQDWQWIMENVPVGVLARPGDRISARTSKSAKLYRRYKLPGKASHILARSQAPAWCFLNVPMVSTSSTAIRASGHWRAK